MPYTETHQIDIPPQALLQEAFAILMTAASAEGVGKPVFS